MFYKHLLSIIKHHEIGPYDQASSKESVSLMYADSHFDLSLGFV